MLQQKFKEIGELIAEAVKNGNYKIVAERGGFYDYSNGKLYVDDETTGFRFAFNAEKGYIVWIGDNWLSRYIKGEYEKRIATEAGKVEESMKKVWLDEDIKKKQAELDELRKEAAL